MTKYYFEALIVKKTGCPGNPENNLFLNNSDRKHYLNRTVYQ